MSRKRKLAQEDSDEDNDAITANLFLNKLLKQKKRRKTSSPQPPREHEEHEQRDYKKPILDKNVHKFDEVPWEPDVLPINRPFSFENEPNIVAQSNKFGNVIPMVQIPGDIGEEPEIAIDEQLFCFACSHVGERLPGIKGTSVDELLIYMGTGITTTNFNQHCINCTNMYDETIRHPINAKILAKNPSAKNLLPEWSPQMVRAHLETHHIDPTLTTSIWMHQIKNVADYILKGGGLIEKRSVSVNLEEQERTTPPANVRQRNGNEENNDDGIRRPPASSLFSEPRERDNDNQSVSAADEEAEGNDESDDISSYDGGDCELLTSTQRRMVDVQRRINPEQYKIWIGLMDMYLKLGKCKPQTMIPFYSEDRYGIKSFSKHPFLDTSTKIIYQKEAKNAGSRKNSGPNSSIQLTQKHIITNFSF